MYLTFFVTIKNVSYIFCLQSYVKPQKTVVLSIISLNKEAYYLVHRKDINVVL